MAIEFILANVCSGLCNGGREGVAKIQGHRRRSRKDVELRNSHTQTQLAACDFLVPHTPLRPDESARLQRLCELQALGIASGHLMDEVTAVLGWIVEVPIVMVSMVTAQKLCFQSRFGFQGRQAPREEHSLCAWCISPSLPTVLVVDDATKDGRVCQSGIVKGPPYIRFYAGCPLQTSDGFPLGTLCLIDQEPRHFSNRVSQLLINFAEIVTRNIERFDVQECELPSLSLALEEEDVLVPPPTRESHAGGPLRRERVRKSYEEAHILVLVSPGTTKWPILWSDSKWNKLTSISILPPSRSVPESLEDRVNFWDVATWLDEFGLDRQSGGVPRPDASFAARIRDRGTFRLPLLLKCMSSCSSVEVVARCVPADLPLDSNAAAIHCEDKIPDEGRETFHIDGGRSLYFFVMRTAMNSGKRKLQAVSELSSRPSSTPLFDDVTLQQLVGSGSYGKVYLGDWIGAQVAVKVLQRLPGVSQPGSAFEASLSAALSHPNIVQTFEYGTREVIGEPSSNLLKLLGPGVKLAKETRIHEAVIVQEWCDRGCLTKFVEDSYPMGPRGGGLRELVDITADIASALSYMHDRSIVHGDLSSNNVLLTSRPTARGYLCKVCDFGLARAVRGESIATRKMFSSVVSSEKVESFEAMSKGKSTAYGHPVLLGSEATDMVEAEDDLPAIETYSLGTVQYMPPEMLLIHAPPRLTVKADIYSLGVIVWQLVSGKPPWEGLSAPQVVIRVNRGKRLAIPEDAPGEIAVLIASCMEREAGRRPEARKILGCLPGVAVV